MLKYLVLMMVALSPMPSLAQPEIVVLGDSISASHGMRMEQGWVALLQSRMAVAGSTYRLHNESISGETSAGGLARLGDILAARKPAWVLIELGVNDGLRGLSVTALKANLSKIIERVRKAGGQVMLLGMKVPSNYGKHYIDQFYQVYPQLSEQLDVPLLPYILEDIADNPQLMQVDGLHPNAKAQPFIADKIETALFPLLK